MLRTYDDWRAGGPHEDMPNADEPRPETCEVCGGPVAAVDPAWCWKHHGYSTQAKRPEHLEESDDDGER